MFWIHTPTIVIAAEDGALWQGHGVVSSSAMVTSNG
jgi:hypothetical protein